MSLSQIIPVAEFSQNAEEFKTKFEEDIQKCNKFLEKKIDDLIHAADNLGNQRNFVKAKNEIFLATKSYMTEMEKDWFKCISRMKHLFVNNVKVFLEYTKLEVKLPTNEVWSSSDSDKKKASSKSPGLPSELKKLSNSPGFQEASQLNSKSSRHSSGRKSSSSSEEDSSDSKREERKGHQRKKSGKSPKQKDASVEQTKKTEEEKETEIDMSITNRTGKGRKGRQTAKVVNTKATQLEKEEEVNETETDEPSDLETVDRRYKSRKSVKSTKHEKASETCDESPKKAVGKAAKCQPKSEKRSISKHLQGKASTRSNPAKLTESVPYPVKKARLSIKQDNLKEVAKSSSTDERERDTEQSDKMSSASKKAMNVYSFFFPLNQEKDEEKEEERKQTAKTESSGNYSPWLPLKSVDNRFPTYDGVYEMKSSLGKMPIFIGFCHNLREKLNEYKLGKHTGHNELDDFISKNMDDIYIRFAVALSFIDAKKEVEKRLDLYFMQYKSLPMYNSSM